MVRGFVVFLSWLFVVSWIQLPFGRVVNCKGDDTTTQANGIETAGSGKDLGSGVGPSEAGRCKQHLTLSSGPHPSPVASPNTVELWRAPVKQPSVNCGRLCRHPAPTSSPDGPSRHAPGISRRFPPNNTSCNFVFYFNRRPRGLLLVLPHPRHGQRGRVGVACERRAAQCSTIASEKRPSS